MSASHLAIALVVALVVGGLATVYLLRVQRAREVTRQGVQTLAVMRWREFSQFVLTALQAQGFDASPLGEDTGVRHATDMVLTRDGRTWLLSCRQAPDFRVGQKQVEEMEQACRVRGAVGGIIVTLGTVDPKARRHSDKVELIDGAALWPLICPLLPPGLLEHAGERASAVTRRHILGAWGLALALGVALLVLPRTGPAPVAGSMDAPPAVAPTPTPTAPATVPATPVATGTPTPPPVPAAEQPSADAALPDAQQRQAVTDRIRALPGVASANWSSRSTLQIVARPETPDLRDPICKVLLEFEQLRASRVQLQAASGQPARFFHCAAY